MSETNSNVRRSAAKPSVADSLGPSVSEILHHLFPDADLAGASTEPITATSWVSELSPCLARTGRAITPCQYSAREVAAYSDTDVLFLTCVHSDAGQIQVVVVRPTFKRRARVTIIDHLGAHSKRLTASDIARLTGLSKRSDPGTWGLVRQMRPLETLRTPPKESPDPLKRLRQLIHLEGHTLRAVIVYALVVGVMTLATPLAVQSMVNTIAFGTLVQPLIVLTLLLLVGLLFAGGLRVLETIVIEFLQRRIFAYTASDFAHRISSTDIEAAQCSNLPELTNRFLDVAALQKVASSLLLDGVGLILQTAVGLLVLAFYHPLLLAFDVLIVLALTAILIIVGRSAISTAVNESTAKYAVHGWLESIAATRSLLRVSRRCESAIDRADRLTHAYLAARERHFSRVVRQVSGLALLQAIASALLLGLGGWLVMIGELSLGQLVASELIVTAVVGSMVKFGKHLESFYDCAAAVDKMGKIIDLPLIKSGRRTITTDQPTSISITGVQIANGYANNILRNVNLEIPPASRIALTGPAGAGKSLFLSALSGNVTQTCGEIRLGGELIKSLESALVGDTLRLLQTCSFIPGTLLENVRFYDSTIAEKNIVTLLSRLGAAPILEAFPAGLHSPVQGTGAKLPHDLQVQISIAREVLTDPGVLLIDGLLDSVSPSVRDAILSVVLADDAPWSVVITTHDPQIMNLCNRVLRIIGGRIAEVTS